MRTLILIPVLFLFLGCTGSDPEKLPSSGSDSIRQKDSCLSCHLLAPDPIGALVKRQLKQGDTISDLKTFEKYLSNNISVERDFLTSSKHRYKINKSIGYPDCNGTFCIEENDTVIDLDSKDTATAFYWAYLGFYGDINLDGRLDLMHMVVNGEEVIWDATHFRLLAFTFQNGPQPKFVPLTDTRGRQYFIDLDYPRGLFDTEEKDSAWLRITGIYWPF